MQRISRLALLFAVASAGFLLAGFLLLGLPGLHTVSAAGTAQKQVGWIAYNGGKDNAHYSPLTQITPESVSQLKQVWRFDAGTSGGLQTNPLVVDGTLYAYTTALQVVALSAATGEKRWSFDSGITAPQPSRGFSWWSDGREKRLYAFIMNYVYAINPEDGKPIPSFGEQGRIDLRKDLGVEEFQGLPVVATTPGVIFHNLLIVGFRTAETKPAARGDIRAYDVKTGKLQWSFHTIPHPGEPGYETWPAGAWQKAGAANNWSGMALDEKRGIVYVPTGSAASDFYGADRAGKNLYANTLLALDAATGKLLWHFQGVHHDIWDRDFPSPPTLLTVVHEGKKIDAIAQPTKQGFLFVLDRVTGKPVFPIEERSFPTSDIEGETTSPTQPVSTMPAPYARQELTESILSARTPEVHEQVLKEFRAMKGGGLFVPMSLNKQTIVFPGFDGGAEWGGSAVTPAGVLILNANDIPWTGGLTKAKANASPGETVYQSQCAFCHGKERKGDPPEFPSLVDVGGRLSEREIEQRIHGGSGRMPSFPGLTGEKLRALLGYLTGTEDTKSPATGRELASKGVDEAPYQFTGYRKFQDKEGYPAVQPPWGTLNAIDLNTGKYLWRVPLGEYPELVKQGMPNTGSEGYGGPVVTAGGVVFIGATIYDRKLRAFDARTGKLLWSAELPYAGTATPATYSVNGKQYVVIAASGARDKSGPQGAAYIAFALP